MLNLTNTFFQKIESLAIEKKFILEDLENFFYDIEFTPKWLIEHVNEQKKQDEDDEIWRDGGHCYEFIFNELMNYYSNMILICSSEDIKENYHGDYDYLYGVLPCGDPFIYHQAPWKYEIPSQLTIFGTRYTIHMRDNERSIEIYETIEKDRNRFFIESHLNRISAIKYYLQNIEREL